MATQRTYEVMFIVDAKATDEEITRLNETLQQVITDQGGSITKHENMGRRHLAYPIGRQTEGHYVLERFPAAARGEVAKVLERATDALRAVLRDGIDKAMAQHNG